MEGRGGAEGSILLLLLVCVLTFEAAAFEAFRNAVSFSSLECNACGGYRSWS